LDDRVWKNVSIALGVICALLIGVAAALMVVGHKSGTPGDTTQPSASLVASGPISSGTSNTPSNSSSPGPTGSATAKSGAASPTLISFSNLGLDAEKDPLATTRTFTFQSNGVGDIVANVTKISKGGYVRMCLSVDGSKPSCGINKLNHGLSMPGAKSDATPNTWTVTLVGYKTSHPTVDVTLGWTTATPQITLTHGRFQGNNGTSTAATDALGGLTATFKPRGVGTLNFQATWTIASTDASMSLSDVSSSSAISLDQRKFQGVDHITPVFTANVDGTKSYQVKLVNTGAASTDRPDLTAQISFP
jgi:hypothetical protein